MTELSFVLAGALLCVIAASSPPEVAILSPGCTYASSMIIHLFDGREHSQASNYGGLSVEVSLMLDEHTTYAHVHRSLLIGFKGECEKHAQQFRQLEGWSVADCVDDFQGQVQSLLHDIPRMSPWQIKCAAEASSREQSTDDDSTSAEEFSSGFSDLDALSKSVKELTLELESLRRENRRLRKAARVPAGIFPMLRDMGCTHANLETPRLLREAGGGRLVVDVGLGDNAKELFEAVGNGFNVIGIEMLPANIASLRRIHGGDPRIVFVNLDWLGAAGEGQQWAWPAALAAPPPPLTVDGRGFAYIVHAALGNSTGEASWPEDTGPSLTESLARSAGPARGAGFERAPIVRLDDVLPGWVGERGALLLKLDTQGWELPILQGAMDLLERGVFSYVIYEFSPWLMWRERTGRPVDLAKLLPSMGAICFDSLSLEQSHNSRSRPSRPLSAYVEHLQSGPNGIALTDMFGPWDDITCVFL